MIKKGKRFSNAEVTIDYIEKSVNYSYPCKYYNENLSFFLNGYYRTIGYFFGMLLAFIYVIYITETYPTIHKDIFGFYVFFIAILIWLSIWIFFCYLSLFIHKHSKIARDNYPESNALFHKIFSKHYKINLNQKFSISHYIHNNKLIFFPYSIAYTKYSYIGDNPLIKVETKDGRLLKKEEIVDVYKFIMIFTFKNKIKDGYLEVIA